MAKLRDRLSPIQVDNPKFAEIDDLLKNHRIEVERELDLLHKKFNGTSSNASVRIKNIRGDQGSIGPQGIPGPQGPAGVVADEDIQARIFQLHMLDLADLVA